MKQSGLNIASIQSYISPPLDHSDSAARQLYAQLVDDTGLDSSGDVSDSQVYGQGNDAADHSGIESTSEEFN